MSVALRGAMRMDEALIEKILHKFDSTPLPEEEDAATQLGCSKAALELLGDLLQLPEEMQKDFVIILTYFARRALLSEEEKDAIFGKNVIENGLAEKILVDGSHTATVLLALEHVDKEQFPQAAALLMDIPLEEWSEITIEWESQWELSHSTDAALVRLLAHRCGNVAIDQNGLEEMTRVVHERHPSISKLFSLISNNN